MGSMAERRRSSRLMTQKTPRFCPEMLLAGWQLQRDSRRERHGLVVVGYTNEKNAIEIAEAIAALGFREVVKGTGTQDGR